MRKILIFIIISFVFFICGCENTKNTTLQIFKDFETSQNITYRVSVNTSKFKNRNVYEYSLVQNTLVSIELLQGIYQEFFIDLDNENKALKSLLNKSDDDTMHIHTVLDEIKEGKLKEDAILNRQQKYKIYKENKREVTVLKTENFDDIIFIEVGALVVGDIHNKTELNFTKGEEKGYFSMGGSTVVLLVKDKILKLDDDILENSEKGIETKVNYAERIGRKLN